jgi:hypothetical protein
MVTARHLTSAWSAARHASSTRRACGHRPRALISRYRGPQEKHPPSSTPPRTSAAPLPLPLTVFLDGDHLLSASPLCPTSGLVFAFLSTTAPWGTSPTSTPPTRHRSSPSRRVHRRRKPTQVSLPPCKSPNWVPPPLGHVPRQLPLRPRPSAGRISPVCHRRRGRGGIPSPISLGGPKLLRELGCLAKQAEFGCGLSPKCTVNFIHFL